MKTAPGEDEAGEAAGKMTGLRNGPEARMSEAKMEAGFDMDIGLWGSDTVQRTRETASVWVPQPVRSLRVYSITR
jgi:hypothetical protein